MYIPVKAGDNVKVIQLLSLGYSANSRLTEADNRSPLHVAASEGHVLTTHILVQAGGNPDMLDDEQNTPLMIAAIKGKVNPPRITATLERTETSRITHRRRLSGT